MASRRAGRLDRALLGLLAFACLVACSAPAGLPAQPGASGKQPAFKGMELYSWKTPAGEWAYAILGGTNRRKLLEEVQEEPLTLEEVKRRIAGFAEFEHLSWSNEVMDPAGSGTMTLPFPPDEVIEELRAVAKAGGVSFWAPGDEEADPARTGRGPTADISADEPLLDLPPELVQVELDVR